MKFQRRQGFTPLEIKISNGRSKKFLTGFTIVELLTVLAIITILMGILVPTISFVRNTAREAKQKTQLATIDMAIMAFKGDRGYYPPSDWRVPDGDYCGAQKLAVALVGRDLLGFRLDTDWTADDLGDVYNLDGMTEPQIQDNLNERTGPYLELTTANAFRLGISAPGVKDGLFDDPAPLRPDTFVLCDSFGAKKITIGTKTVTVGAPILYFRANTSSKSMTDADFDKRIYSWNNNLPIISLGRLKDGKQHPIWDSVFFYDYITDRKVTAVDWPYRPDSYILISAGVDGLYGTNDDICNF
jgi:type II secretory pathway pseudopilin PulG